MEGVDHGQRERASLMLMWYVPAVSSECLSKAAHVEMLQ